MSVSMKKDNKFATPAVEDLIRVDEQICKKQPELILDPMTNKELGLNI
jgi:hypothetical protein